MRGRLAVFSELCDLARRDGDVRAGGEHRCGDRPAVADRPYPNGYVGRVSVVCSIDGVAHVSKDLRLMHSGHRERPRFAALIDAR